MLNANTATAAKHACYDRLHPEPWISTSKGARILYDAVCLMWQLALARTYEERAKDHIRFDEVSHAPTHACHIAEA